MTADESQRVTTQLAELYQDVPGEHGISGIRELSDDELRQIERDDHLIVTSANAAPFQRCRQILGVVIEQIADLQEADPAGPGEVGAVRAAFGSLMEALGELDEKLKEVIQEFSSGEAATEFARHATQIRESPAWRQVEELADPDMGSFMRAPDGAVVWRRRSDDALIDPSEVAVMAVNRGQVLLLRHYAAVQPMLIEAAVRIRELAAEAPGGTPGVVEITIEDGEAKHMTPRPLAVNLVQPAVRAARIATRLVERFETAQGITIPEERGAPRDGDAEADSTEAETESATERGRRETVDAETEDVSSDEETAESAESQTPLPLEFSSLFGLARNLHTDLEKVWSAALDETLLDPAVEKQLAAVGTLLNALQRKFAAQDQALQDEGIEARIMEWPLSDESLAALILSPDLDARTRQSRLAQLNALLGVVETFESLKQPGNVTVTLGQSGEAVERFWSAGAFALLRDRLRLLERTTQDHGRDLEKTLNEHDEDATEEAGDGEDEPTEEGDTEVADSVEEGTERTSDAFERLRLGTQAWIHGDPEAAVFHAVSAVAGTLNVSPDLVSAKLAEEADERQASFSKEQAEILTRAAEMVTGAIAGSSNLAVATLLAQSALRAAHVLILGPVPGRSLSPSELAALVESRRPLQPLEAEQADAGT